MYLFPHHVLPLVEPGTLMNVYLASGFEQYSEAYMYRKHHNAKLC